VAGNRASDEMAHLWLQVLPHESGDATIDPRDDPTANKALGAVLLAGEDTDGAIPHLNIALKGRPDYFDAHYNYNLGNALAAQGDFAEGAYALSGRGSLASAECQRRGKPRQRVGGDGKLKRGAAALLNAPLKSIQRMNWPAKTWSN
jgi:tetratricopeptide (TPR) repeat protein